MSALTELERTARLVSGQHEKYSLDHKFGRNTAVTTTFVPICNGGFYRTPIAATSLEFVSSSADDAAAGVGAQEITVVGLDANWDEVSQTVETNGITAVALGTDLIRLYRYFVSRSGTYGTQAAGSHTGDLTIQETGAGDVWATISATDFARGQSQIGVRTIPNGKRGHIASILLTVDSARVANIILFKRENADDVSTPFTGVMRGQAEFDGVSGSLAIVPKTPLGPFPAKTDVGFMAKTSSGTAAISVDFEILLEDVS